jgi:carboxylesterase
MQSVPPSEKTAPFTLGPSTAKTAVLLVHGFTGSPWEVRPLGEALADRGYHVEAPLLPGHGGEPEAMLWVTWREWLGAAEAALRRLAGFERVLVSGLSMGALLSLLLAARHPSRVKGLALLAPVARVQGRRAQVLRALRHLPLRGLVPEWVTKDGSDLEQPEARAEAPLLPRYPVARVLDLFTLQDVAADAVQDVRCPSLVLAARNDHVVDFDAVLALHARLPGARLVTLQRGFHQVLRDTDRAVAITAVADFFDGLARP